jgi:hypothetical protein
MVENKVRHNVFSLRLSSGIIYPSAANTGAANQENPMPQKRSLLGRLIMSIRLSMGFTYPDAASTAAPDTNNPMPRKRGFAGFLQSVRLSMGWIYPTAADTSAQETENPVGVNPFRSIRNLFSSVRLSLARVFGIPSPADQANPMYNSNPKHAGGNPHYEVRESNSDFNSPGGIAMNPMQTSTRVPFHQKAEEEEEAGKNEITL